MSDFNIVTAEQIERGDATDAYFARTEETLEAAEKNPTVVAEVTADQFASDNFEVLAGLDDAAELFKGMPVDVDALHEGQLFDGGPVMRITGNYLDFDRYETALLGFLSHASGIATNALRARHAAPDCGMLSFGARHVNPALAGVVERSALIGGADGFSHMAAGDNIGREPSGTMPHALMLSFGRGNQEEAWETFNEAVSEDVSRIPLCDTFTDETDEVRRAVETLGEDIDGVRLDTTGSRRGNFKDIIKEVQWQLDRNGRDDVDVIVSGGLGPEEMRELRDVVDAFGIGGYISNATPIDFGLDIVHLESDPTSKRGKLGGVKEVYRTPDGGHETILQDEEVPAGGEKLLQPFIRDGEVVRDLDIDAAANRAQREAAHVGFVDYNNEE